MARSIWQIMTADELSSNWDEVNRENRAAIRFLAAAGLPLSIANALVQILLASEIESLLFFLRTSWVFIYFLVLLAVERWIIPDDYKHATALLYIVEIPVIVCSILLGTIWDPDHQAITFLIFLMAMPAFVLDRPIRVIIIAMAWVVTFLLASYCVKTPEIFERDFLHVFEFFLAAIAVANVVIRVRIVALRRLGEAHYHLEHDELTKLQNRRALEERLPQYVGKKLTIVVAELDQLSMYNDFYGHDVGNEMLVKSANCIAEILPEPHTFRYGGDEILSVVQEGEGIDCQSAIETCRAKMKEQTFDTRTIALTCAFSYVSVAPSTIEELKDAIQLAVIYAHKAKHIGRNQTIGGAFDQDAFHQAKVESNIDTHAREFERNALTGLPSMSYFVNQADSSLSSIFDFSRNPMIGFIAISDIKQFNNRFGYAQGDELIRFTAQKLQEGFPNRLLCCITGNQFALLCYKDEIDPGLSYVYEQLNSYKSDFPVAFRAGFARFLQGEDTISQLDKARIAQANIGSVEGLPIRFYDRELHSIIKHREYIISHLDEAIEKKYLEVYYQPIIRSSTGKICNEEALARWNDPKRGLLAPVDFIPSLEESHLVYKLNLFVLKQVLKDMERKKELGLPVVPISINLSRYDFEQCDMVQEIIELVDASPFSRKMICIEITESAFTKNQGLLKREVARFREAGFEVWMDDFGSEYSTLSLLQDLDFDLVKLDMQFMKHSSYSSRNLIIVSNVVNMISQMGMETLVEGVENQEHMGILQAMDCDKLQGYLFSKPSSLDEVIDRVQNRSLIPFEDVKG